MNTRLTHVINLLKEHRPITIDQVKEIGIKTTYLGSGAFRKVYNLPGCRAVLKLPITYDGKVDASNKEHAVAECRALKILNGKNYVPLKRYLPVMHHCDRRTGVIVMEKYKELDDYSAEHSRIVKFLKHLTSDLGLYIFDLWSSNVGLTKFGEIKIMDLGLF